MLNILLAFVLGIGLAIVCSRWIFGVLAVIFGFLSMGLDLLSEACAKRSNLT